MILGTVIKGVGGLYTVRLDTDFNGKIYVNVRGRGSFRHEKLVLLTGDRVELEPLENDEFFCKKILDRKNSLIRPPLANLDVIFAVIPCVKPMPDLHIVDKMLCIAEHNGIEPVIIITKADLDTNFAKTTYETYKKCGYSTFITSSESHEGVEGVLEYIKQISTQGAPLCAFAGVSGAGKSTLINAIFPNLTLQTGELSEKIERGKNTTRHTELFAFDELIGQGHGGYLADTPGFSLLDFERFDFFSLDELFGTFREFDESVGKCKYTKCTHTKDEGCDILRRVNQGEIPKSRHESYVMLYEILKKKPSWKGGKK
jgi:ribosome biogenesis GTPase